MSHKKSDSQQYVEDFNEWQEKRNLPGEYLGGNFPMHIKYGGKIYGYYILILSLAILLVGILMIFQTEYAPIGYVWAVLGLIFSYAGWNKIRRSKRK